MASSDLIVIPISSNMSAGGRAHNLQTGTIRQKVNKKTKSKRQKETKRQKVKMTKDKMIKDKMTKKLNKIRSIKKN